MLHICASVGNYLLLTEDADSVQFWQRGQPLFLYRPVIMHSHDYVRTKNDVDDLVKLMDKMNIKKTMIVTCAKGKRLTALLKNTLLQV